MSKSSEPPEKRRTPEVRVKDQSAILDRKYRHSLQPKSLTELPLSSLRHTQSHRYDSKNKKSKAVSVSNITSILEAENSEDEVETNAVMNKEKARTTNVVYENEKKPSRNNKAKKNDSNADNKATFSFENAAFEGNMHTKRNSNTTIRTISSRAPSIQSLEVVREQYCCCAKRTKCERTLLTAVTILTIIIIVLVIVIVILAKDHDLDELRMSYLKL